MGTARKMKASNSKERGQTGQRGERACETVGTREAVARKERHGRQRTCQNQRKINKSKVKRTKGAGGV